MNNLTTLNNKRYLFLINFILFMTSIVIVALLPYQVMADDEVNRIEIHTFESMTLNDQQFLQGSKTGPKVTLAGELRFPRKKMKRYPVVVLVHGSGGVSGYIDDWAKELNKMGAAVFILDSFTGRGIYKVNSDQSQLGRLAQIVDAYRALDVLAQHKHIDKSRIALMGFSRGGQATLYSSLKRFQKLHGSVTGNEYSAYLAFYPACGTSYKHDSDVANKPIRIFHGSADNYNPIASCRNYVKRLQQENKDVELYEYAGAHHVYDYKKLKQPFVMKNAQTTRNCVLAESGNGKIVNAITGKRFTYADPCVEYGPTLAFNQAAYNKTKEDLEEFMQLDFELH